MDGENAEQHFFFSFKGCEYKQNNTEGGGSLDYRN